jgi:predicted small lipoprotein YifL
MHSRSKPTAHLTAATKKRTDAVALRWIRALTLLPLALLCACGQTGPLFLPDTPGQSPELTGGSAQDVAGSAGAAAAETDEDTEEGDARE